MEYKIAPILVIFGFVSAVFYIGYKVMKLVNDLPGEDLLLVIFGFVASVFYLGYKVIKLVNDLPGEDL